MGVSIANLKAMLTLDTSGFNAGFASAGKTATGFASGIGAKAAGTFGGLTKAVVGAGAAMLVAGVGFNGMFESLKRVGSLSGTAKKLGLSVEAVQKLGMAAEHSGVDLDTLSKFMFIMGKNIGSGGMSMDKRFLQVSDAIAQIKDPAERGAAAFKVFGKGGYELIGLLSKGSDGIRRSADAIDRFGLAIKDVDAAKAKEAVLSLKELKAVLGGIKDQLMIQMSPAINSFVQTWLNGLEVMIKKNEDFKDSLAMKGGLPSQQLSFLEYMALRIGNAGRLGFFDEAQAQEMINMRNDADRNRKNAITSRVSGLGNGLTGGGASGAGGGKLFSRALQFGSVEAASAITNASGNPFQDALKPVVDKLTSIERGLAAANRKATESPLRPSNLRGGGPK